MTRFIIASFIFAIVAGVIVYLLSPYLAKWQRQIQEWRDNKDDELNTTVVKETKKKKK